MEKNRNNSLGNFSRRQILTAAGVAGAALPLVHSFPAGTAHAQTQAGLLGHYQQSMFRCRVSQSQSVTGVGLRFEA